MGQYAVTTKEERVRILTLDIETKPHLVYCFDIWNQNIGIEQIKEPGGTICWAARWLGEEKVRFASVFHDGLEAMLRGIWDLLDEADVVMTYNGRKFDIPHLNRMFVVDGFGPPSPYQQIDLYMAVRKKFNFPSKKLDYICRELEVGRKVQHNGFPLWRGCMDGDPKAWAKMKRYNKRDVRLTEEVHDIIQPWIPSIPSHGAYDEPIFDEDGARVPVCPACGSTSLQPRGYAYTAQSKFPRYVCGDCGKWSRGTSREAKSNIVSVAE